MIHIQRQDDGKYTLYVDGNKSKTDLDIIEAAEIADKVQFGDKGETKE